MMWQEGLGGGGGLADSEGAKALTLAAAPIPSTPQAAVEALYRDVSAGTAFPDPPAASAADAPASSSSSSPDPTSPPLSPRALLTSPRSTGGGACAHLGGSQGFFDETLAAVMAAAQNSQQPAQVSLLVHRPGIPV